MSVLRNAFLAAFLGLFLVVGAAGCGDDAEVEVGIGVGGECEFDEDCESGLCDDVDGVCVDDGIDPEPECLEDADCDEEAGEVCLDDDTCG